MKTLQNLRNILKTIAQEGEKVFETVFEPARACIALCRPSGAPSSTCSATFWFTYAYPLADTYDKLDFCSPTSPTRGIRFRHSSAKSFKGFRTLGLVSGDRKANGSTLQICACA